jgi:hypothetical protein
MSREGTAVISVIVLQNSMDFLKGELVSTSETCVISTHDGNENGIEAERVSDITKEEDQEPKTIPLIKTEPKVRFVPGVSVTHVSCMLYPELLAQISVCPCGTKLSL